MNDFLVKITIDLPIENYMDYIINFFNIALVIIAIYSIELMVCLYFCLRKKTLNNGMHLFLF